MTPAPPTPARDAAYFDQWYADMADSDVRDAIVARTLGLPADMAFASLLSWDGIAEVGTALDLTADALLLDVACGRGGYGIEIARRTGARLVGIDFSGVAVKAARRSAARRLGTDRAEFHVGTLVDTRLADGGADALMCIDSVQFADPPLAALAEFRRLLARGGRLAVTCWQVADRADDTAPPRIRAVDLQRDLSAAGFADVEVHEKPLWRRAERALWEAAVAAPDDSDPAVRALQEEAHKSLAGFDALTRVLATATAP